ncbi:MAG: 50S ribosomal protein L30 [Bacteroidetes bacterium]|nr:50S ribosomal protein L30 [Bacteroidota bacterium]
MSKVKIIQTKSVIGKTFKQKRIVKALGLKGIGSTKSHVLNPSIQGMLNKVSHLLEITQTK